MVQTRNQTRAAAAAAGRRVVESLIVVDLNTNAIISVIPPRCSARLRLRRRLATEEARASSSSTSTTVVPPPVAAEEASVDEPPTTTTTSEAAASIIAPPPVAAAEEEASDDDDEVSTAAPSVAAAEEEGSDAAASTIVPPPPSTPPTLKRTHHYWLLMISTTHILLILEAGIADMPHFVKFGAFELIRFVQNAPFSQAERVLGTSTYYCQIPDCETVDEAGVVLRGLAQPACVAGLKLCECHSTHLFSLSTARSLHGYFVDLYRQGETAILNIEARQQNGGALAFQCRCAGAFNARVLNANVVATRPNLAQVARQAVKAARNVSKEALAMCQNLPLGVAPFAQRLSATTEGADEIVVELVMGRTRYSMQDNTSSFARPPRVDLYEEIKNMSVADAQARVAEALGTYTAMEEEHEEAGEGMGAHTVVVPEDTPPTTTHTQTEVQQQQVQQFEDMDLGFYSDVDGDEEVFEGLGLIALDNTPPTTSTPVEQQAAGDLQLQDMAIDHASLDHALFV